MIFRTATAHDRPALTGLWEQAFGDPVSFIDLFFEAGFAPRRSLVAVEQGQPAAMLYWFDATLGSERYAYIYAVATDRQFQGRGIATALMQEAHRCLAEEGYAGAILSPGSDSLFRFYGRMGYETAGFVTEQEYAAGAPLPIRKLDAQEFAALRAQYLPASGMAQEGANLSFLSRFSDFYAGTGFVACAARQDAFVQEFLGAPEQIPGLVGALGLDRALVRMPGGEKPLVMGLRFDEKPFPPVYFGFPFD